MPAGGVDRRDDRAGAGSHGLRGFGYFGVLAAGAIDRYGSGLGLAQNSWAKGMSGAPVTYWADTALEISSDAGNFDGGLVRLVVHLVELALPRAVLFAQPTHLTAVGVSSNRLAGMSSPQSSQ